MKLVRGENKELNLWVYLSLISTLILGYCIGVGNSQIIGFVIMGWVAIVIVYGIFNTENRLWIKSINWRQR